MSASFSLFDVHRVEVSAYSAPLSGVSGNTRMHCQRLVLFDSANTPIGEVILFLDQPFAALAIGDCSELDGFQAPVIVAPAAFPTPALQLISQVSGF
jgi:hypothetical protein